MTTSMHPNGLLRTPFRPSNNVSIPKRPFATPTQDTFHFGASMGGGSGSLPPDKNNEEKQNFSQSIRKRLKSLKPSRKGKNAAGESSSQTPAQTQQPMPPEYQAPRTVGEVRHSIDKILDADGPPTAEGERRLRALFQEETGHYVMTENQRALMSWYNTWPRQAENQTQ